MRALFNAVEIRTKTVTVEEISWTALLTIVIDLDVWDHAIDERLVVAKPRPVNRANILGVLRSVQEVTMLSRRPLDGVEAPHGGVTELGDSLGVGAAVLGVLPLVHHVMLDGVGVIIGQGLQALHGSLVRRVEPLAVLRPHPAKPANKLVGVRVIVAHRIKT